MALEHYEVTWQPAADVIYTVNLMIEPDLVDTAMRGTGVKETPARIELARRVRNATAVTHSQVRMQHIIFTDLTITKRA